MAVTPKPNQEYYDLKARLDKWGAFLNLAYPLIGIAGFLAMAILSQRIHPVYGPTTVSVVGIIVLPTTYLYLVKRKIGFSQYSEERCQNCGISMARWGGMGHVIDYWCRNCGNKNYIDLGEKRNF